MKKLGFSLLFFTTFQLISVIISYEFYWFYTIGRGGGGSVINQVHWIVLVGYQCV